MFLHLTITVVAAPLAVVSAVFALVLGLYGIPRAVGRGDDAAWIKVLLSLGNVGLVVAFLWVVTQRIARGIDPVLFTKLAPTPQGCPPIHPVPHAPCDPVISTSPSLMMVQVTWAALVVAVIWYTISIRVIMAQRRTERLRRQRAASSSK